MSHVTTECLLLRIFLNQKRSLWNAPAASPSRPVSGAGLFDPKQENLGQLLSPLISGLGGHWCKVFIMVLLLGWARSSVWKLAKRLTVGFIKWYLVLQSFASFVVLDSNSPEKTTIWLTLLCATQSVLLQVNFLSLCTPQPRVLPIQKWLNYSSPESQPCDKHLLLKMSHSTALTYALSSLQNQD